MKKYNRILKESNIKNLDYYLNFYKTGLKQLNKLSNLLLKLNKYFKIEKIELPNGWSIAKIYFKSTGDDEEIANSIYKFLKNLNIPVFHDSWSHGDSNTVTIELSNL